MAALNLVRANAVPARATILAGGPTLFGVGQATVSGTVKLTVKLGTLAFADVEFAVVDDLPVPALLGKPTLAAMHAKLDLFKQCGRVWRGGRWTHGSARNHAGGGGNRPKAQSYWNWISKRMAAAPQRLQTVFQDVVERADDSTLEQFLASFAEWKVRSLERYDPLLHPAISR
jgi:hypothetical protein